MGRDPHEELACWKDEPPAEAEAFMCTADGDHGAAPAEPQAAAPHESQQQKTHKRISCETAVNIAAGTAGLIAGGAIAVGSEGAGLPAAVTAARVATALGTQLLAWGVKEGLCNPPDAK